MVQAIKRNEEGQIVVDENGMPTLGENRVLGNVSPDFRMGFNTTFEFYKFRLSAVLDWKQGGCIMPDPFQHSIITVLLRNQQTIVKQITSTLKPAVKQLANGSYTQRY